MCIIANDTALTWSVAMGKMGKTSFFQSAGVYDIQSGRKETWHRRRNGAPWIKLWCSWTQKYENDEGVIQEERQWIYVSTNITADRAYAISALTGVTFEIIKLKTKFGNEYDQINVRFHQPINKYNVQVYQNNVKIQTN